MKEMFLSFLSTGAWAVIKAVLLLVVALIVAKVVKSLVVKLLTKTKLSNLLAKAAKADTQETIVAFVGKLTYLLVFLLFVPGIFECLGMHEVSTPILSILNTMWGYLPNVLAAAVILCIGFFVAKLVRELLVPVFDKIKVNRLQEKAGMEVADSAKLSNTLAYIVYVLILIPVIITALRVLNISAISEPAIAMLNIIFTYIPGILAALVIIVIGCMVAKFAGNIVKSLIASAGLDAKLANLLDGKAGKFELSKVIGMTVQIVMIVFFAVESLNVLHLEVITSIGAAVIGYLPYVLAAVLILIACYICNAIVQKALKKNGHTTYAIACQCAIYMIGGFMVLSELGIAKEIVNTVFIVIVAAIAVAFAISFGIGGRQFASRTLKKLEDKFEKVPEDNQDKQDSESESK